MTLEQGQVIVYVGSSICMGILLLVLLLQCLQQVGWWPKRLRVRNRCFAWLLNMPQGQPACAETVPLSGIAVFCAAIAVQWLLICAAYLCSGVHKPFPQQFWERFTTAGDAPHYLFLAQNGYVSSGEQANLIVFYPLYPLMIRILTGMLGSVSWLWAVNGLIISQVCSGLSAVVVVRIAEKYLDHERSLSVLAAWVLYPYAFFGAGVYTESLFMLLSLTCLWMLDEKRWLAAGISGFFAALCRTQGVALFFPAILCFLRQERKKYRLYQAAELLLIPLGMGVYLLCNKIVCGDWFAYIAYQAAEPWYNTAHWIGDNLVQHLHMAIDYPWHADIIYIPQLVLYFLCAGAIFSLLARQKALGYALYSTAYLGMSYLHGWMISGGRYMLGCFALYLALGHIRSRIVRIMLLVLEAACALYMTTQFMYGRAIM